MMNLIQTNLINKKNNMARDGARYSDKSIQSFMTVILNKEKRDKEDK